MAALLLFGNTNMAAVTSRENTPFANAAEKLNQELPGTNIQQVVRTGVEPGISGSQDKRPYYRSAQ